MRHIIAVIGLIAVAGCSGTKDPWGAQAGPKIVAYFPPLYSLAASVAGDDAQVISLISNVGPHHFEPTTREALALHRADLFLTIGLGLDDVIAEKLAKTSGNSRLKIVELGELLPKEILREGSCKCCKEHGSNHAHEHAHTEYDPHVWLGVPEAVRMIEGIRDELVALDPPHAEGYRTRAAAAIERLNALHAEGKSKLAAKSEKPKVITFHDSMFYFARSFGIEVVDSIEAPGVKPSPKKMAQLVEDCKKNGVRLIAVEPQYPSNTEASAILRELRKVGIDAAFVELDPIETANLGSLSPDYYERTVRENINRLAAVLK